MNPQTAVSYSPTANPQLPMLDTNYRCVYQPPVNNRRSDWNWIISSLCSVMLSFMTVVVVLLAAAVFAWPYIDYRITRQIAYHYQHQQQAQCRPCGPGEVPPAGITCCQSPVNRPPSIQKVCLNVILLFNAY